MIFTYFSITDKDISMGVTISTLTPVYLNALIWAICPLLGWGHYGIEPFGLVCSIDWSRPSYSYILCIFLFVFLLPLTLMLVCYSRIFIMVRNTQMVSRMVPSKMDVFIAKVSYVFIETRLCVMSITQLLSTKWISCTKGENAREETKIVFDGECFLSRV